MDIKREIRLFKQVYDDAMYAPYVRWNLHFKTEKFKGMTPYICIQDICDHKYVICAIPEEEATTPLQEQHRRNVIVEYSSIEEMVIDGWRLDT